MRSVTINIHRSSLVYDIGNYAYIEAHRRDSAEAHIIADLCQDGNADRLARVLAAAYGEVTAALRHHSEEAPDADEYSDQLWAPETYTLRLRLSRRVVGRMPQLTGAIHEYMVCAAIAHWLDMLREDAAYWRDCASAAMTDIRSCSMVRGCCRRGMSPF